MSAPPDLVTTPYALALLAEMNLSAAQQAAVPALVSAASTAVRRWCRRLFTLETFDELYAVEPPDREILLRQSPVVSVDRVASGADALLTVSNDLAGTPRATAALATTGDAWTGLTVTGLALKRWTSGAAYDDGVSFTAGMTAAQLAAAVNGLGSGWSATVLPGYEPWPVADLRPPQGAYPATSGRGARFRLHLSDLDFRLDERAGVLTLGPNTGDPGESPRWGPAWAGDTSPAESFGGEGGVRVVYAAGFATVPADVQLATVDAVRAALSRLGTNAALQSASDGTLSYSFRGELLPLPREVVLALEPWVNRRA